MTCLTNRYLTVCHSRCLRDVCLVSTVLSPSLRCVPFLSVCSRKKRHQRSFISAKHKYTSKSPPPDFGRGLIRVLITGCGETNTETQLQNESHPRFYFQALVALLFFNNWLHLGLGKWHLAPIFTRSFKQTFHPPLMWFDA